MIFFNVTWQVIPGIWGLSVEVPFIKIMQESIWPVIHMITEMESGGGFHLAKKKESIKIDLNFVKKIIKIWPSLVRKIGIIKRIGFWLLSRTRVKELKWTTEIGAGEAAKTGMLVGTVWSFNSFIYGMLQNSVRSITSKPQISVVPNFRQPVMAFDVDCIFELAWGHIITAGFKMMWLLFIKKGG